MGFGSVAAMAGAPIAAATSASASELPVTFRLRSILCEFMPIRVRAIFLICQLLLSN